MGQEQKLVTIAAGTRVRAEDNPGAEVVAELPKDTEIEILVNGETFVKISAWHSERGRVSGWVHRNFISGLEAKKDKPQRAMIVDPPCIACGALHWLHTYAERHLHLNLLNLVAIKNRICLSCGLVQACVGGQEAEELLKWYENSGKA